jgi:hypothetical protein
VDGADGSGRITGGRAAMEIIAIDVHDVNTINEFMFTA